MTIASGSAFWGPAVQTRESAAMHSSAPVDARLKFLGETVGKLMVAVVALEARLTAFEEGEVSDIRPCRIAALEAAVAVLQADLRKVRGWTTPVLREVGFVRAHSLADACSTHQLPEPGNTHHVVDPTMSHGSFAGAADGRDPYAYLGTE